MKLSHVLTDALVDMDEVSFIEDRNTIRLGIVNILQTLLKEEEKIDVGVRQKIGSQKKEIPEGSAEYDILYRKYYADELKRLGISAAD
jgi:hypothetical protein